MQQQALLQSTLVKQWSNSLGFCAITAAYPSRDPPYKTAVKTGQHKSKQPPAISVNAGTENPSLLHMCGELPLNFIPKQRRREKNECELRCLNEEQAPCIYMQC